MSMSDVLENSLLKLLLNAVAFANIADNAASSPDTSFYLSLHTADPGDAGNQSTSEISYTGYARVAVARTSGGWTIVTNVATLAADAVFGPMTAGAGGTATFAGLGRLASGTGTLLASGALSPTIVVSNGVTPKIAAGTTFTFD